MNRNVLIGLFILILIVSVGAYDWAQCPKESLDISEIDESPSESESIPFSNLSSTQQKQFRKTVNGSTVSVDLDEWFSNDYERYVEYDGKVYLVTGEVRQCVIKEKIRIGSIVLALISIVSILFTAKNYYFDQNG